MSAIDFTQIRSTPKSCNDSFEKLSVQLFSKSCAVPAGSIFIPLRGDGGDGGLEAYFRAPSDTVYGVQAKYFFQLKTNELRQIATSLKTALVNHPNLLEYWIYVPFDLTGPVAAGRRGKSEAERFEEWKLKVEGDALSKGSSLTIKLCPATVIQEQLLCFDANGGMRAYWFDDNVLTKKHIKSCLDAAEAFAGPRYSAGLDIITAAHIGLDFFGGIGDLHTWYDEHLAPVISDIRSLKGWGDNALRILEDSDSAKTRFLIRQVITKFDSLQNVTLDALMNIDVSQDLAKLLPLLIKARQAQEQLFYKTHGQDKDTPSFRQFQAEYMCCFPAGEMDASRELEERVRRLQAVLTSQEIIAGTVKSLLLVGPAGIGKTHAIVSAALRRLAYGGYSLVVFGDDFKNGEPWEVLRSKLGFGANVTRGALFECLQSCSEHTGIPFIIYIDALNESPRDFGWKNKLPELLEHCSQYAGIKVCISTRDTYKNLVVDTRFPGFAFEHVGFSGYEFETLQAFADYYELDMEITPLFSPEICNPLFLHLACKVLRDRGEHSLDLSFLGFWNLFDAYLEHCNTHIRERLQCLNPQNIVKKAMQCLSELLVSNLSQERTWDDCRAALQELLGREVSLDRLLEELRHEGLIIVSRREDNNYQVRLGYQRYGDILRAVKLVESVTQAAGVELSNLAKNLHAVPVDAEGLLEALAFVLPELTGIEITSDELGLDKTLAHRLFIDGLIWRSRKNITASTQKTLYDALHTPNLWQQVYEVFFSLSLVPGHLLNAQHWLHPFFQHDSGVNRDAFLSRAALKSFEDKGSVWALINAALRADIAQWTEESRRLATITLAWLTSCADRRVRDLSTKGLMRLVANQPDLGQYLVKSFCECSDDYILESITLSIYCACLLERERKSEFIPLLDELLKPTFDIPNVLVRDSIRLLGCLLRDEALSQEVTARLNAFPRKTSLPIEWPTLEDAKPLLDIDHLPINMKLWGGVIGTDFWRYKVEPRLRGFDLKCAKISQENVACWLMVETLKLGYPGRNKCALAYDGCIINEYGGGRGRQTYAERLGKKYYWIQLHRLIGLLADNIALSIDKFSEKKPNAEYLWSVDMRKADMTDIRDISPPLRYPDEILYGFESEFPDPSGDIKHWVRSGSCLPHEKCVIRNSDTQSEWITLSLDVSNNNKEQDVDPFSASYFQVTLSYSSVFINDSRLIRKGLSKVKDVLNSHVDSTFYRGYIAEYPNSSVFDQLSEDDWAYSEARSPEFSMVTLARGAEWEYDYSHTTQERQESLNVPCRGIVNTLGLKWDRQRGWIDSNGLLIAFEAQVKQQHAMFIRRPSLNDYLKKTKRSLVYRRFVNRSFYNPVKNDGPQIDLFTWLLYHPRCKPIILDEEVDLFNC